MTIPIHALTPAFDQLLQNALDLLGIDLQEPRDLAAKVLRLSDFYLENPGHPTPWNEPFAAAAYLGYFLPLNFVRLGAAWSEVKRFLPPETISEIWDFGSGLGTTQWVLEGEEWLTPRPLFAIENSEQASGLHRQLLAGLRPKWKTQFLKAAAPKADALAVFSYSFLEMQNHLPNLKDFSHLLIVEPSTRTCGRDLMAWRQKLLLEGFTPLAPCTHAEACPLLTYSQKDWCHQRIHLAAPEWFGRLENHLPMKNRTLTYSYLLMSRTVKDEAWRRMARAIGDTLVENGKTRQMICRGPAREFLSWLHKHGPPPEIPHGALIRGVDGSEVKGADLRPSLGQLTWTV